MHLQIDVELYKLILKSYTIASIIVMVPAVRSNRDG